MSVRECRSRVAVAITAVLLTSTVLIAGAAAPTKEQKCEAKKNQTAGEYADCLARAQKKLTLYGDATDYAERIARCDSVYSRDLQ